MIYLMGGQDSSGNQLSTVYAYNPATDTWTQRASMPSTPGLGATTGPDGLIYAVGGVDSQGAVTGEVEAYNPATDTWTQPGTLASLPTASTTWAS